MRALLLAVLLAAIPVGASAQPWGVSREPARTHDRDRSERDYPERDDPRDSSRTDDPPRSTAPSAWTPPPQADPAVARCEGFRRDLEAVLRQEMRGGDHSTMKSLRAQRQSIYQAQLRAGC